jgi:6,7-dimethyl-8-ribityllumazine synthase
MSSADQNLSDHAKVDLNASDLHVAVVYAAWNPAITESMRDAAVSTLKDHGFGDDQIAVLKVPGSFELPHAAQLAIEAPDESESPDAVICIGCIIKGDTRHDEFIAQAVAQGLTRVSLEYGTPVIFGVLTTENQQQAEDRAGGKHGNKGAEAAFTALEMMRLTQELAS